MIRRKLVLLPLLSISLHIQGGLSKVECLLNTPGLVCKRVRMNSNAANIDWGFWPVFLVNFHIIFKLIQSFKAANHLTKYSVFAVKVCVLGM